MQQPYVWADCDFGVNVSASLFKVVPLPGYSVNRLMEGRLVLFVAIISVRCEDQ